MYPRELNLDADTEQRLISYIETELLNHYMERTPYMERLLQQQRDYWAEPTKKRATQPFLGASTIVIPLTAIAVEAIHARTMTTLFALNQLVSAVPLSPGWMDVARPVERFLNKELLQEMKIRRKAGDAILELEKFGTGIAKVGYERVVKTAIRSLPDGTEQAVPVTIRDGATIDAVANGRFLMPFSATDPQTSPWCGEEHSETPYVIRQMEESGFFRPGTMAALEKWVSVKALNSTGVERQYMQSQEGLEHRKAQWPKLIDWCELWLGFNTDRDPNGYLKEIVVHYHRPSRKLLSVRYNWHDDLHRPYRVGVYFPLEHRWMGIGICKQNEQFQRSITTQHRQRLDNGTMANVRMLKISKLSGYGPDEPIFPGKMWFLDDMTHVDSVQFGEVYNSAFNNEQATLIYHEKRVGVNETILGTQSSGTPGTATGDLARIQESNKRFDFTYQNIKEFTGELVIDTACIIQQFGPRRIQYFERAENGNLVRRFFEMPAELIRGNLLIELRAAGQQQNKIVDRNNWVQIATLLQQYFQGNIALAQVTGNGQLIQYIAMKGIAASTEAMTQILESFDVRNIERITLSEIADQLFAAGRQNASPQSAAAGLLPGGAPGAAPAGAPSGMDILAQIIQAFGGRAGASPAGLLQSGNGVGTA